MDRFERAVKYAEWEGFILGIGIGFLLGLAVAAGMLKWMGVI